MTPSKETTPHDAGEARVHFRDLKPYDVPEALTDLRGPAGGTVTLPHSVLWLPDSLRHVDLDDVAQLRMAYRALITEGTLDQLCEFINGDRLSDVWHELRMDPRPRAMWEARFPELVESEPA